MTESFLTTDIIVIIVLFVVLVIIGICAFLAHFYWTKIGVAEIWNTAKWSSMRSSFYQTVGRLSRSNSNKYGSERPFSAASVYSDDGGGHAAPASSRNTKPLVNPTPPTRPTKIPLASKASTPSNNTRRNSGNQIQPVSSVSYNNSANASHGSLVGQAPRNTKIHNIHEGDVRHNGPSVMIHDGRF